MSAPAPAPAPSAPLVASTFTATIGMGCLVLFGLPFLLAGLGTIGVSAWTALRVYTAQTSWVRVDATLEEAHLDTHVSRNKKGGTSTSYRCRARYRYTAAGREYTGERVGFETGSSSFAYHRRRHAALEEARRAGRPVPALVDPQDPANAVLYAEHTVETLFMLCFGTLFAGVGGTLMGMGIYSSRGARNLARRRGEHPDRPWRHEGLWDDFVATDARDESSLGLALFGGFLGVFAAIPTTIGLADPEARAVLIVGALLALPSLILFGVVIYRTLRRWKYGRTRVLLPHLPLRPGTTTKTVALVDASVHLEGSLTIRLRGERRTTTGSGKSRRTDVETIHDETTHLGPGDLESGPQGGVRFPLTLAIPAGLPSRTVAENPAIVWMLTLSAETPGIDYHAEVPLPVFDVAEARVEKAPAREAGDA